MSVDKTSEVFDLPRSDISLRSVDSVIFKVHRGKLMAYSDVFEGMFESSHDDGEPIQLTEVAEVLEGFLRFFYSRLYPQLDDWTTEHLFNVASCSRKYEVRVVRDVIHRILLNR